MTSETNKTIKETLLSQLQLLSEASARKETDPMTLCYLSKEIAAISVALRTTF